MLDITRDIEAFPTSYANHSTTWTPVDSMTPVSTAPSRKRSRDETAFEAAEAENSYFPISIPDVPAPIPEEEPIYGEGMVLLNPQTGRPMAAESQTGTWYEEKVEEEAVTRQAENEARRPKMPVARKSQRLSQSSIRAALSVQTLNDGAPASPPKSTPSAEIDEATIALGVGWTQIGSEDPDLQAAARGWARYIDVHYARSIHGAQILLKNKSPDAYLVGCQEGFFLFQEDLLCGQLVSRTWEGALNNLRASPMQFEGMEVLQAERTPGPDADGMKNEQINGWYEGNRFHEMDHLNGVALNGQDEGTGMDLS